MEEIDNIIIHSLRQIGCCIEDDIQSLKQFSTELVIEATVKCLEVIQYGLGLPQSLPGNLSARFRLASSIAQTCQDIGYTGDVGFQTFLYSSETDIRKIFMFLIEKLPKEPEKVTVDAPGSSAFISKAISEKVKSQLSSVWVPRNCLTKGLRWFSDGSFSREGSGSYQPFETQQLNSAINSNSGNELARAWREYYVNHLPTVSNNSTNMRKLMPTMISLNSRCLLPSTEAVVYGNKTNQLAAEYINNDLRLCAVISDENLSTLHTSNQESLLLGAKLVGQIHSKNYREALQNAKPKIAPKPKGLESDPTIEKKQCESNVIGKIKEEMEILRQNNDSRQVNIRMLTVRLGQLAEESTLVEKLYENQLATCSVKRKTYDLLPEAQFNVTNLQEMVESSAQKLVNLALQWDKHRSPLLQLYRHAKQQNSDKASESQLQVEAVRGLREKSKDINQELHNKEHRHIQLLAEYDKIPKDVNRSAYTRRILEIIGNICKQKDDIDKVLKDTKDLQKEINNLSGQLDRSFTVADELIFRDAKKDEASRKAYKLLATLHSDCNELVQMVQETGASVREIRELEEQIEMESVKNVGGNLERISADLKQMKQESAVLTAQVKSKS